jgi:hypothetical protein
LVGAWPNARTASCTVLFDVTAMARYCTLLMRYGPTIALTGFPSWNGERPA